MIQILVTEMPDKRRKFKRKHWAPAPKAHLDTASKPVGQTCRFAIATLQIKLQTAWRRGSTALPGAVSGCARLALTQ